MSTNGHPLARGISQRIATQAMDVLRQSSGIAVMRDDWSPDSPQVKIQIDPDRANVVGISNADVANSTAAAISGASVGLLKEGNKSIPRSRL